MTGSGRRGSSGLANGRLAASGAFFGSEVIGGDTATTVELSLTDGELGDSTGVDGQIIDPGGPALFAPEPGFGAAFLSGLLMLRWLAQRRRGRLA